MDSISALYYIHQSSDWICHEKPNAATLPRLNCRFSGINYVIAEVLLRGFAPGPYSSFKYHESDLDLISNPTSSQMSTQFERYGAHYSIANDTCVSAALHVYRKRD